MPFTRREFLTVAAAASIPAIIPARVWAADPAPNDQITVGIIGTGKQGRHLLDQFKHRSRIIAVCDVDTTRREDAQRRVIEHYNHGSESNDAQCDTYNDYRELIAREDIDAVCIATPDHWHAVQIIESLRAGKDIYCEKPLTHNIHESVEVIKAVAETGRVLQTGSMQRSMSQFRIACELVRNGVLGHVHQVNCAFGDPGRPCDLGEEEMEPGLDWDRWLGPAQVRPYNSVLSPRGIHDHYPNWRAYMEFGGGRVADWGAHHLDIAQWGLGMDHSGPVEVIPTDKGPGATDGAVLVYGNGTRVHHLNHAPTGLGVQFIGAEGEIAVDRAGFSMTFQGEQVSHFTKKEDGGSMERAAAIAEKRFLTDAGRHLYKSSNHVQDFLDCMRTRTRPNTHEVIGARSAICCHLLNLSYHHGERLSWDPQRNAFAGGTGRPEWLTREYRGDWSV